MSDTDNTSKTEDQPSGAVAMTVQDSAEHEVGKPLLRCCFDASETKIFAAGQDRHIWQIALTGEAKKENDDFVYFRDVNQRFSKFQVCSLIWVCNLSQINTDFHTNYQVP